MGMVDTRWDKRTACHNAMQAKANVLLPIEKLEAYPFLVRCSNSSALRRREDDRGEPPPPTAGLAFTRGIGFRDRSQAFPNPEKTRQGNPWTSRFSCEIISNSNHPARRFCHESFEIVLDFGTRISQVSDFRPWKWPSAPPRHRVKRGRVSLPKKIFSNLLHFLIRLLTDANLIAILLLILILSSKFKGGDRKCGANAIHSSASHIKSLGFLVEETECRV